MTTTVLGRLFGISGKIAVVTDKGCNSSIDIAPVLAEAGARVVIADQRAENMQPAIDKILSVGGEAVAIEADVESEASVIALFDQVKATWGTPDIVVNCAAMT